MAGDDDAASGGGVGGRFAAGAAAAAVVAMAPFQSPQGLPVQALDLAEPTNVIESCEAIAPSEASAHYTLPDKAEPSPIDAARPLIDNVHEAIEAASEDAETREEMLEQISNPVDQGVESAEHSDPPDADTAVSELYEIDLPDPADTALDSVDVDVSELDALALAEEQASESQPDPAEAAELAALEAIDADLGAVDLDAALDAPADMAMEMGPAELGGDAMAGDAMGGAVDGGAGMDMGGAGFGGGPF